MAHFFAYILLFMQVIVNVLNGMANSVDPDQPAPSALFAYAILSETLLYVIFWNLQNSRKVRKI